MYSKGEANKGDKMSAVLTREFMMEIGTTASVARFPDDAYVLEHLNVDNIPFFKAFQIFEVSSIKQRFSKGGMNQTRSTLKNLLSKATPNHLKPVDKMVKEILIAELTRCGVAFKKNEKKKYYFDLLTQAVLENPRIRDVVDQQTRLNAGVDARQDGQDALKNSTYAFIENFDEEDEEGEEESNVGKIVVDFDQDMDKDQREEMWDESICS